MCMVSPKCGEDTSHRLLLVCIAYLEQFQEFVSFNVSFVGDAFQHVKIKIIHFLFLLLWAVKSHSVFPEPLWSSISPQSIIYSWGECLKTAVQTESSST